MTEEAAKERKDILTKRDTLPMEANQTRPLTRSHNAQRAKDWPTPPRAVTSSASSLLSSTPPVAAAEIFDPVPPTLSGLLSLAGPIALVDEGRGLRPRPPPPSSMTSFTFSLSTSLRPHLTTAPPTRLTTAPSFRASLDGHHFPSSLD
ncbi:hypothetical protein GW17_00015182 [Ensete ventricosum]|nr:hypothetical protein GW17_00015182 [Ensete ventricosum]